MLMMDRVVRGRLHGRSIELDEPIDELDGEVEVTIRRAEPERPKTVQSLLEFLKTLPPGTRSKDDIDRQIAEERDSWGDGDGRAGLPPKPSLALDI